MGILWPHSNQVVWANNGGSTSAGTRARGAKAYFFEAGTETPRTTYSDAALATPNTHPVVADGYGRFPAIFLAFGDYRERVRTSGNTTIWDTDDIPNAAPFTEDLGVDENALHQTGDFVFVGKNGTRDGCVRCNGRTIGSASSGATERANPDTADLYAYLWDNYPDTLRPTVSGGAGANAAADFAANKTIQLPDHRGATLIGFDDMGSNAAGDLGHCPIITGSQTAPGSLLGANTHTLLTAHLPSHTHTFSATTGAAGAHSHTFSGTSSSDGAHTHTGTTDSAGAHSHTVSGGTRGGTTDAGNATFGGTSPLGNAPIVIDSGGAHTHTFTTGSSGAHSHTYSGTTSGESDHTHSVSGTTGSTGSDTAHNIMQRSCPVTVLMRL